MSSPCGDAAGASERIQYWFDVETARLVERGRIIEGRSEEHGSELVQAAGTTSFLPRIVPADLEKPPCVQRDPGHNCIVTLSRPATR